MSISASLTNAADAPLTVPATIRPSRALLRKMSDIYSFKVQLPKGELDLAPFKTNGKDLLFVNVASKCGLTPQYKDLQALQDKDADKLQIIGFPCNQVRSAPSAERRRREIAGH